MSIMKIPLTVFLLFPFLSSIVRGHPNIKGLQNYKQDYSEQLLLLSKRLSESNFNFLLRNSNVSAECQNAIQNLGAPGTLKMSDASAKTLSGILYGNTNNLGDRIACIKNNTMDFDDETKAPRYYLTEMLVQNILYRHGLCVPRACLPNDIINGLQGLTNFQASIRIDDDVMVGPRFDTADIVSLVILGLISTSLLIGTVLDICQYTFPLKFPKLLRMFSIVSNIKILFYIPKPQTDSNATKRLETLDGLRFISITWILICHTLSSNLDQFSNTIQLIQDLANNFWGQTIINAFSSVDTFFLLSGILVSFLTIKELDKAKGRLNWFMFYFHRYIRLTAVYGMLIFFFATLYKYFDPHNMLITAEVQTCRQNFWKNLLYINNLLQDSEDTCIEQNWYLECDMQMFIISPIFIYSLWRWKFLGLILPALSLIASTSYLAGLHLYHKDNWAFTLFGSDNDSFFKENYIVPWTRFQPYIIGIVFGNFLYRTKCRYRIPQAVVVFGWIAAFIVGYLTIYGINFQKFLPQNLALSKPIASRVAYGSLHRISWTLALCWVIFSCETSFGYVINKFLSWEFFKPLSKITFLIYLIHMHITDVINVNLNFVLPYSILNLILLIIQILILSIIISIGIYVTIELPFTNIEKYLIKKLLYKKK